MKRIGKSGVTSSNPIQQLYTERKMGELLTKRDPPKGTRGTLRGRDASGGYVLLPPEKVEPTLAELGVSKRESAQAKELAEFRDGAQGSGQA